MSIIDVAIDINAPLGVCFDIARSVDAHLESARSTGERAVGGVTSGSLNLGDEVTWRPHYFRDEMVRGAFRRIVHDHYFEPAAGGTRMRDVFDFTAPFGVLGKVVEKLVLTAYLRRFLEHRAQALKQLAESDAGQRFIVK